MSLDWSLNEVILVELFVLYQNNILNGIRGDAALYRVFQNHRATIRNLIPENPPPLIRAAPNSLPAVNRNAEKKKQSGVSGDPYFGESAPGP